LAVGTLNEPLAWGCDGVNAALVVPESVIGGLAELLVGAALSAAGSPAGVWSFSANFEIGLVREACITARVPTARNRPMAPTLMSSARVIGNRRAVRGDSSPEADRWGRGWPAAPSIGEEGRN